MGRSPLGDLGEGGHAAAEAAGRHAIVLETFYNRPALRRLALAGPVVICAYALVEFARGADARRVRRYGTPAAVTAAQPLGLAPMRPGRGRQACGREARSMPRVPA